MSDLRFIAVRIAGFRSFAFAQEFKFDMGPGLAFVYGRNEVQRRMGGNAVGKSSIFEAVIWCLFGKTSRGVKAGAVKNRLGKEQCSVSVDVAVDGVEYTVARTWGPNSLTLDDGGGARTVEQSDVVELVSLPFEEFCAAVVVPQFGQLFADMLPSAKAQVFSGLMDLSLWDRLADEAKGEASRVDGLRGDYEDRLNRVEGRLSSLNTDSLEDLHKKWTEANGRDIHKVRGEAKKARSAVLAHKDRLEMARRRHRSADRKMQKLEEEFEDRQTALRASESALVHVQEQAARIEERLSVLREDYESIAQLRGSRCPSCRQKVSSRHVSLEKENYEGRKLTLEQERDIVLGELGSAESKREKLDEDVDTTETRLRELDAKVDRASSAFRRAQADMAKCTDELTSMQTKLDELKSRVSPYKAQLAEARQSRAMATRVRDRCRSKLRSLEKDYDVFRYWVGGFKAVKLFQMDEALVQLELETNSVLEALGLVGWKVVYAVDKVTKSKTVRKGFTVLIKSPDVKDDVPWEAWSGGEGQRLRMAMQLGLSNLILNRRGVSVNVQVFDEPTSWLSDEGVNSLLDTLSRWGRSNRRSVWLLDHRVLESGGFIKRVLVRRTESGSKIEVLRNEGE